MSTKDILSQEEVDALLHGVDSGGVDTDESNEDLEGGACHYDFANQDRIVRGRLPTLEMINERFVRYFRVSVFNMLRRSADISVEGVQMIKFSEYVHSLYVPTSLTLVKMAPLRGTALFMIDPKLVFAIVDNFFGGDGRFPVKIEGREFTQIELRVVHILLTEARKGLEKAWKPVLEIDFTYLNHEVNPNLANIVSPSEVVVVSSFRLELEGGGGELHFTMPYSMIEPIRSLLDAGMHSDQMDRDDRWNNSLREEIMRSKVEVSSTLVEVEMPLREINALKKGDIIPFEMPEVNFLMAEDIPIMKGHYGVSREKYALKIDEVVRVNQPSDPLQEL